MTANLAPSLPKHTPPAQPTLPSSLQAIVRALQSCEVVKPHHVKEIIEQAQVQIEDLQAWADYDHPLTDSYGRKLVYKDDNFEVMVMSWAPGDFAAIHDHGYTEWGAVQIFGPAEHATFAVKDNILRTLNRWEVVAGEIVTVNHDLIHQMGNSTTDAYFLSLHVYGHHENLDNITGDARIYELDQGIIQRVDGGVFFALPESLIKRTENGPQGDYATSLRHRTELLRRIFKLRMAQLWEDEEAWLNLLRRTYDRQFHTELAQMDEQAQTRSARILNWELQAAKRLLEDIKAAGI